MTAAKVGNVTLASYTYAPNNGDLLTQTYANGDSVSYTYDLLGRTKTASSSDGRTLTYSYSGDGQLSQVTETQDGKTATYVYNYDTIGRLISLRKKVDGDTVLLMGSRYNSKNQLIRNSWRVGAAVFSQDYTYNAVDGSINTVTMPDQQALTMGYDSLRRLSTVTGGVTAKRYLYRTFEDNTTTDQVTSLSYTGLNQVFQYSYDVRGNIATYAAPGKSTVTYTYDKQGQLLSASNGYSYTYDNVGNILTATKNGTTHTYTYSTYDWKDKLISYDGQAIAYDASGNPTSYYNGTRWTFGWENGRELSTATSGNTSLSFAYDGEGVRTSKTVNGVEHKYYYSGGKLLRETYSGNILDFAYNADGTLYSLRINGTYYYYVTNLQGDVIAIVDANGTIVASYEYDPYGDVISATGTLAEANPMRYRGYYYDSDTHLYYLQSRYYDPELGRFINADVFTSTGQGLLGNNMFAYCQNNPINKTDPNGYIPVAVIAPFVIGAINNAVNAIYYEFSDGESDVTSDSYTQKGNRPTRWEKLDYTKHETREKHYNTNAWRYYSEYTFHEYGWYLTGWSIDKNIFIISELANRFADAHIWPDKWDGRPEVDIATILFGILGL